MKVEDVKSMSRSENIEKRVILFQKEAHKVGYHAWQVEMMTDGLKKDLESREPDTLRSYDPEHERDFTRITRAVHPDIHDRSMFEKALHWEVK